MDDPDPPDPLDLLNDIADPEERARTAREWGLAFSRSGIRGSLSLGDGPEASLNRAAYDEDTLVDPGPRRPRCCPRCRRPF